jgi:hypothetical protein
MKPLHFQHMGAGEFERANALSRKEHSPLSCEERGTQGVRKKYEETKKRI